MSDEPVESPFSDLAMAAIGMHEMFTSWVDAGFTRAEALELTKTVLASSLGTNNEKEN